MPQRISLVLISRIAAALFLALIWLLPFCLPDHKVPIGTFWQEWTSATLLVIAFILHIAQPATPHWIGVPKIILTVLGLVLVIAVQSASGLLNFSNAIIPLLYLALAGLACMLGSTLRQRGELDTLGSWIALACVIGGIFTVHVQWTQWLGLEHRIPYMSKLLSGQSPFGNINQTNHAAAYLGIALASALYLRFTERLSRPSTGLSILILTMGLVLTGQRSALVYVCIPLALTLLSWRKLSGQRNVQLGYSLALPLLFIAMNIVMAQLTPNTLSPLAALETKSLYDDRANLWQHSWAMLTQHPLLGVGFNQYWPEFFEQLDTLSGALAPTHPHNLVAALLSETGLVGTFLVGIPLLLWLWRARHQATSAVHYLGLIQLAIIGFHSLIEYPLWYSYFLIIAAFWLGACDPAVWTLKLQRPKLVITLLLLTALPVLIDIALSYEKLRRHVWHVSHPDIMTLASFEPSQPEALAELHDHWFFRREALFWEPDLMVVSRDQIGTKIALNREAMNIAPSSLILYRQVLLLVLNDQTDEAVRLLQRAKQIYPERYRSMQLALPLAAKKWPQYFNPVLPKLLGEPLKAKNISAD